MPTMFNSEFTPEFKPPSLDYIFKKTSDEKTLILFESIALSEADRSTSLMKAGLTSKQYYGRISGLMDAGLIKRYRGKYSLTLLGMVVYNSLNKMRDAIDDHQKRLLPSLP
jgi:predicted transcriptional regulator